MADLVTTQKLIDTVYRAVHKFTNISDGTGETNVEKIDPSTLNYYQTEGSLTISRIGWSVGGGSVVLYWEGESANTPIIALTGNGVMHLGDLMSILLTNNATSPTGKILFSTIGFTAASSYTIILETKKVGFTAGPAE